MRELNQLYRLYVDRRSEQSGDGRRLVDLAVIYDGGLVTRVAELDETAESSIPNLVAQGIDWYARNTASTQPVTTCAPVRRNIAASRNKAMLRELVYTGWYQGSKMTLLDYQRFRYYYGYGSMPAVLRPHPDAPGIPRWEARSPLGILPGPKDTPYTPVVPDCFTAVTRTARWVKEQYGVDFGPKVRPDSLVEVVEYTDAEQITVFCVGPSTDVPPQVSGTASPMLGWGALPYGQELRQRDITRIDGPGEGNSWLVLLSSVPNLAGVCTVSCPGVISLSKVAGFVNGILSKHKLMARLTALYVEGVAAGIRPDQWLITDPNANGQGIVKEADGLRGGARAHRRRADRGAADQPLIPGVRSDRPHRGVPAGGSRDRE
jgi:hypothetical protein